jgi:hypothetical protein
MIVIKATAFYVSAVCPPHRHPLPGCLNHRGPIGVTTPSALKGCWNLVRASCSKAGRRALGSVRGAMGGACWRMTGRFCDASLGRMDGRFAMRIAQIVPVIEAIASTFYRGTRRVVHCLAEELVALGHDVTLFASGVPQHRRRSIAHGRRRSSWRLGWRSKCVTYCVMSERARCVMSERARRRASDFNVLRFHFCFYPFSLFPRPEGRRPMPRRAPEGGIEGLRDSANR